MVIIGYDGLQERGIRYSRPHLWRLWTAGKFPKPVKLSASRNCWLESDISVSRSRNWARGDIPSEYLLGAMRAAHGRAPHINEIDTICALKNELVTPDVALGWLGDVGAYPRVRHVRRPELSE
jgi:hypothetical protein